MKLLVLGVLVLLTGCKDEALTKKKEVEVKKMELTQPKPELPITIIPEMFRNCILLYEQPIKVIIQGKEYHLSTEKEILDKLILEKQQVAKSIFYVIADRNIPFQHIVDVIDVLERAGIDNYELVDKSPVQPEFESVLEDSKDINLNDLTYLKVEMLEAGYQVTFLDQKVVCSDDYQVDQFIINNKSKIDKSKVLLVGKKEASLKSVKPILEVFKKHNYWGFKIITI